ncbi:MAG: hypothetical protein FE041_01630 [Thermoplasmata archaeon]|nr:MAG: hypothetical protein FE041_01630 [Thermoplasmata archaeon]
MKKVLAALIVSIIALQIFAETAYSEDGKGWSQNIKEKFDRPFFRLLFIASLIINIVLLISLLIIYINSFLKTKSSFTLGLVFFIGVLLIQRILVFYLPFLPHLFETLALIILLILSLE